MLRILTFALSEPRAFVSKSARELVVVAGLYPVQRELPVYVRFESDDVLVEAHAV